MIKVERFLDNRMINCPLESQDCFCNLIVSLLDFIDRPILQGWFGHHFSVSLHLPLFLSFVEYLTRFDLLDFLCLNFVLELVRKSVRNNYKSKVEALTKFEQHIGLQFGPIRL